MTLTVTRTVNGAPQTSSVSQSISVLTDLEPRLTPVPTVVEVGTPVAVGLVMTKGKAKSPAQLTFDDGTSAAPTTSDGVTFATTNHTYSEPGKYYLRATVQDVDDAIAPGVTGPENFASTSAVVTVHPVACVAPASAPTVSLPLTVRLGNNLFISWTADPGLDPRIDTYEVEVSTTSTFSGGSLWTYRPVSDYQLFYVGFVPTGNKLYVRVRTVKQCATVLTSAYSNVASTTVETPPTVVSTSSYPAAMFYRIGSEAAVPTARYCYINATYSTADAVLALSLSGTDASAFTFAPAALTLAPGQSGCVTVTPTAEILKTAGRRTASLLATYTGGAISSNVQILVSASNAPPPGTTLRSAAAKLNFSAPSGQTPLPMTLSLNISPPPRRGRRSSS